MSGASRRNRSLGRVALVTVVVLAVGGAGVAASGLGWSGGGGDDAQGSYLPPATATITRETLVDTQTESGGLGHGDTTTVAERIGGTVTALAAAGSTVKRGQTLYRVDDQPVVLLYGSVPAYRELSIGTEGTDVKQLEKNLSALGYDGFTADDSYTWATAEAVKNWQEDLGLVQTGTIELGRIFFAQGPVLIHAHEAAVGDAVLPGAPVLTSTGTSPVVTVELDVSDQRLAVEDSTVVVSLPDGTTVEGSIASTRTVVVTSNGGTGGSEGESEDKTKIEVTITVDPEAALAGLDQASVRVAFTASQREDVLTVPVAALLALAEGGYGVEVVEGTTTRIVAVDTGLFAGGRVEISGKGLGAGMTVGVPS